MARKGAASSTPIDPQIEVPGTYAIGTLPLGPLWVSDVPGLVLGPSFGLLGSQIKLDRLFYLVPVNPVVPLPFEGFVAPKGRLASKPAASSSISLSPLLSAVRDGGGSFHGGEHMRFGGACCFRGERLKC